MVPPVCWVVMYKPRMGDGGAMVQAAERKPSGLEWKNEFRWPESLGIVFGSEVVLRSSPAVGVLQSII